MSDARCHPPLVVSMYTARRQELHNNGWESTSVGHATNLRTTIETKLSAIEEAALRINGQRVDQAVAASAMLAALEGLVGRPALYNGNDIVITADSHWDGIQRMLNARDAIAHAKAAGVKVKG